jgi:hypothetical protein
MSAAAQELFTRCGAGLVEFSREQFTFPRSHAGSLTARIRHRLPRPLAAALPVAAVRLATPWYRPGASPKPRVQPRPQTGFDVRPLDRFGDDYGRLWSAVHPAFARTLDKTPLYMNWRYVECPTCHPIRLGLYGPRGLEAVAVGIVRAGLDRHRRPCATFGEIVELLAPDPLAPGTQALLTTLMRSLDRRRVDAITSTALSAAARPLLEHLGFVPRSCNEFAMVVRLQGSGGPKPQSDAQNSWYYTAGDGDSLYCSGV